MSIAQLVITAVVLEGRSKSEVAREYHVSRYWVQQLVKRYHDEGEAAFEPRSRRPHHNARAVDNTVEDKIVRLRKSLIPVTKLLTAEPGGLAALGKPGGASLADAPGSP